MTLRLRHDSNRLFVTGEETELEAEDYTYPQIKGRSRKFKPSLHTPMRQLQSL